MTKKIDQHKSQADNPADTTPCQDQQAGSDKKSGLRWCDRPDDRDYVLTREEARGGSPSDISVGGEEDAGVGLEFLVRKIR